MKQQMKLDLALILPRESVACAACLARILDGLKGMQGVHSAHIDDYEPEHRKLCLHFDPDVIRLESVKKLVESAGGKLGRSFEHLGGSVVGLRHERHARLVEETLGKAEGVLHVAVAFGTSRVLVELDPEKITTAQVTADLERLGVRRAAPARPSSDEASDPAHDHSGVFGERAELAFSLVCGALTGAGWVVGKLHGTPAASTVLFIAAYGFGGSLTLREVTSALRAGKFEIDFLMLLAAAGAAALGEWFEGALLLFLFTLGHALEGFAMGRARRAIEALADVVPETATVLKEGVETELRVEQLAVGDRILVRPHTRVPADGFVELGAGSIDQAPITGESVPVDKRAVPDAVAALQHPAAVPAESRVFAGTINGSSALTICVTKLAGESTLSRVVKMVSEAEMQKSATQVFADRFERIFVPAIVGVVLMLLFAWVVVDEPFSRSFYRAMAVLVAASPCALAIATPSAVLSGVARAARGGVLVKGGAHLEALGVVKAFAFDKTGTLTEGKPRLTDIDPMPDVSESRLLLLAAALEQKSDHPLARAVVRGAAERLPQGPSFPDVLGAESIIGFGMRGTVEGVPVRLGKPGLFTGGASLPPAVAQKVATLEERGRTVMLLEVGGDFLGVLGVMDAPRTSARRVLAALKALGIEQTVMLTGDNQKVADAIAKEVGLGQAKGDLLPEQKVEEVAALSLEFRHVAMVGDGVNDAPAMAQATVGIAMGAGGSDVALETADVALMADDLTALPFAVELSRAARRIIRQNMWASLGMVAFLIPATIFGFAGIGLAVALHEGSTLFVVANALRLLGYRAPPLSA